MTNAQKEFVEKIASYSRELWDEYKVLPSLTIAQAILESNWGNSGLTLVSNNLFGIKGYYNGDGVIYSTKEFVNGSYITVNATFKRYPSLRESILDHASLFKRLGRYSNILGDTDYRSVCKKVQQDGYATAPTYANSLIKIIEQYNLFEYDDICADSKVKFYVFNSGNITIGDMRSFKELAERLELKDYTIVEQK